MRWRPISSGTRCEASCSRPPAGTGSRATISLPLLSRLADTPLQNAGPGDGVEIVRLALLHQLSAYDAAYLALAGLQKLPLATADTRLAAAARVEGVPLIEAGGQL